MPQRAPGLPENSGIAAVYEDSVMGLSFRVQPWLCPFPAGDLGQVTEPHADSVQWEQQFLLQRGVKSLK